MGGENTALRHPAEPVAVSAENINGSLRSLPELGLGRVGGAPVA